MCTYGRKANYFVKITQSYSSDPRPRPVSPVPLPSVCEEPVTVGPALGPALMTPTHTHTHTKNHLSYVLEVVKTMMLRRAIFVEKRHENTV